MSRKIGKLFSSCLVLAAGFFLTLASAAPAGATSTFLSYSESSAGPTTSEACQRAINRIEEKCDLHGPITTSADGCQTTWSEVMGEVVLCKCTATTTYCAIRLFPGSLG